MTRLTGNQFWKLRTKHGRDKLFSDAATLLEEAYLYFDWCDRHPIYTVELVKYKGNYEEADVPHERPYTMADLTRYLGVSGSYFRSAKSNLREKIEKGKAVTTEVELLDAMEMIEQVIQSQQISGAMVGLFNPAIVARLNGLADKRDITTNGAPVVHVSVRDQKTEDDLSELDDLL